MKSGKRYLLRSPRRGFIEGVARIMDLGNTFNRRSRLSRTGNKADIKALRSDWLAVGQDIRKAIGIHGAVVKRADSSKAP